MLLDWGNAMKINIMKYILLSIRTAMDLNIWNYKDLNICNENK